MPSQQRVEGSSARRVAVVGAGLSGLTAAYRLQKAGWDVTVFEIDEIAGGRVRTVARDGFLIDTGASAVATSYTGYLRLIDELGLSDQIVMAAPSVGIFRDGKIHELRMDHMLLSAMTTQSLSWGAKLRSSRLILDVVLARLRGQLDYSDMRKAAPLDTETASRYARRVLGAEVDDYFVSPIVRTMLIADGNIISKVELLSGIANIFTAKIAALLGGQGRLPQLLAERVKPRYRHEVTSVQRQGEGVRIAFNDAQGQQQSEAFDACVLSCPLHVAARICPEQASLLQPLDRGLKYTQAITVAFGLRKRPDCRSFLVQMPRVEDREVALVFLDHNKSPDRAPAGQGLIDCHWSHEGASEMMDRPDSEILSRSEATVLRLFPELRGQRLFGHVTRWRHALPLTAVGAYRKIGQFNASMPLDSPIQFAADYMSAAGQNTAVELGTRAAERLLTRPARR